MDEREKKLLELRQAAEAHLIERSWTDQAFRERLVRDPRATLAQELGIEFPAGAELEVLEETAKKKYLVLPEPATGDLTDEELENVAGGIIIIGGRDQIALRQRIFDVGSFYSFGVRR